MAEWSQEHGGWRNSIGVGTYDVNGLLRHVVGVGGCKPPTVGDLGILRIRTAEWHGQRLESFTSPGSVYQIKCQLHVDSG